uniref:Uncharacterized protein n=1 Tax=Anopheles culicifacies TaxID=139723 RepID=A0A182MNF2_9DIPT
MTVARGGSVAQETVAPVFERIGPRFESHSERSPVRRTDYPVAVFRSDSVAEEITKAPVAKRTGITKLGHKKNELGNSGTVASTTDHAAGNNTLVSSIRSITMFTHKIDSFIHKSRAIRLNNVDFFHSITTCNKLSKK